MQHNPRHQQLEDVDDTTQGSNQFRLFGKSCSNPLCWLTQQEHPGLLPNKITTRVVIAAVIARRPEGRRGNPAPTAAAAAAAGLLFWGYRATATILAYTWRHGYQLWVYIVLRILVSISSIFLFLSNSIQPVGGPRRTNMVPRVVGYMGWLGYLSLPPQVYNSPLPNCSLGASLNFGKLSCISTI